MWIVLAIYSPTTVFMGYACLAPFFPPLLESKGLSQGWNSIVFGIYSLAQIIAVSLTQKICLVKYGRVATF